MARVPERFNYLDFIPHAMVLIRHRGSWLFRRRLASVLQNQRTWERKRMLLEHAWIQHKEKENWAFQQLKKNNLLHPLQGETVFGFRLRAKMIVSQYQEKVWQHKIERLFALRLQLVKAGRKALAKAQHAYELKQKRANKTQK